MGYAGKQKLKDYYFMKRVRCPKCDNYITFDETKYQENQSLVFECTECGKQFGIRIGTSKLHNEAKNSDATADEETSECGHIVVIGNVFHDKQIIQLGMGDNAIGKYTKSNKVKCQFETRDPSVDMLHCIVNVSRDKHGKLKYILRDGPSYTGTFVDNEVLGVNEKRVIFDGSLFTLGATSLILHAVEEV